MRKTQSKDLRLLFVSRLLHALSIHKTLPGATRYISLLLQPDPFESLK